MPCTHSLLYTTIRLEVTNTLTNSIGLACQHKKSGAGFSKFSILSNRGICSVLYTESQ